MKAKRTCVKCGRDLMAYELSCLQCSSGFLAMLQRRYLPAGEVVPVRGADFLEMLVRLRELEDAASPADQDARDPLEAFKNPLTPYGMLVRALRIVAGTTLMDMAKHRNMRPAYLSGMEVGRKPVTHEDVVAASGYFHGLGIPGTLTALECALSVSNAAMSASKEGA